MSICLVPTESIYAHLYGTSPLCPLLSAWSSSPPDSLHHPIMTSLIFPVFSFLHTCPNNPNLFLITACIKSVWVLAFPCSLYLSLFESGGSAFETPEFYLFRLLSVQH